MSFDQTKMLICLVYGGRCTYFNSALGRPLSIGNVLQIEIINFIIFFVDYSISRSFPESTQNKTTQNGKQP